MEEAKERLNWSRTMFFTVAVVILATTGHIFSLILKQSGSNDCNCDSVGMDHAELILSIFALIGLIIWNAFIYFNRNQWIRILQLNDPNRNNS